MVVAMTLVPLWVDPLAAGAGRRVDGALAAGSQCRVDAAANDAAGLRS